MNADTPQPQPLLDTGVHLKTSERTLCARPTLGMLHVHRSDRADGLAEALRTLLADPPADPFAREVVCVPTRGMERWLTQRMSSALGICANVDFPFPRRLTRD